MQSKQRNWNDLKTAIGTQVQMEKLGDQSVSLDDLFLNIKAVGFDSMVCQTDIVSEEDKINYQQKGYPVSLTASEFADTFQIDPSCVWYTPALSLGCVYFNPESLAVCPFQIDLILDGNWISEEQMVEAIQHREREVSAHDYWGSLETLTDQMRMEYFTKLLEKKGSDIPDLYKLFFSFYRSSDYGFGSIDPDILKTIIRSKTKADMLRTMGEIDHLPDRIKVFRGGNTASTPYDSAYSWSLDINIANFFACRRGKGDGYIVEAEIDKKDIIEAYLNDGAEKEIIVAPEHIRVLQEYEIKGLDFLTPILPTVAPMYHKYKDQMANLDFAQESYVHGYAHQARVLLMCLIIAEALDLPQSDRKTLATAAIYHDTQRVNDDVDLVHGKASKEYYISNTSKPDPVVAFLCEYHCLPDHAGRQEIMGNRQLSKNRTRSQLLFDIFKDADALDRVRFSLRDLDVNQLRLPISKELSLVARICLEQVKVQLPKPSRQNLNSKVLAAEKAASSANKANMTHDKTVSSRSR